MILLLKRKLSQAFYKTHKSIESKDLRLLYVALCSKTELYHKTILLSTIFRHNPVAILCDWLFRHKIFEVLRGKWFGIPYRPYSSSDQQQIAAANRYFS